MTRAIPLLSRQEGHQVLLDFFGCRMFAETQALCEATNVCVDDDALGLPESDPQNDVRRLSADAG